MKNKEATKKLTSLQENGFSCRGRYFSKKDLVTIKQIVKEHYRSGRTKASIVVCKELDWRQPNGWLKERACRDVLVKLEKIGYLSLPPRKIYPNNKARKDRSKNEICMEQLLNMDFSKIEIKCVRGDSNELLWNKLVGEFHYLGFNVLVGRSMKYLVYYGDRIIAASGWSDPAWNIKSRDTLLFDEGYSIEDIRNRGVNNSRFLILPWVQVKRLASFLQGQIIKMVKKDWLEYYSIRPDYLETFVDQKRFSGTCYKASNWIEIGITKGYKKIGGAHTNSQKPKIIYLFPLKRKLRKNILLRLGGASNGLSNG